MKPPKGVGPHEGKELELLLAGRKPLARFSDIVPASFDWGESTFETHVQTGKLIKREFIVEREGFNFRFVYFARPEEEHRIDQLFEIDEDLALKRRKYTDEDDIITGRLLGYSDEEIQIYLNWTQQLQQHRK